MNKTLLLIILGLSVWIAADSSRTSERIHDLEARLARLEAERDSSQILVRIADYHFQANLALVKSGREPFPSPQIILTSMPRTIEFSPREEATLWGNMSLRANRLIEFGFRRDGAVIWREGEGE